MPSKNHKKIKISSYFVSFGSFRIDRDPQFERNCTTNLVILSHKRGHESKKSTRIEFSKKYTIIKYFTHHAIFL